MSGFELKLEKTFPYQRAPIDRGYANQTLYLDLSSLDITARPVTPQMKDIFVGGKGFDLWLLWNAVTPTTRWDDAENAVCIASGPLGGTPAYPGSGKSIAATISPLTGAVIDSNVGGYFGPYLKFAGFDALEIQGKTDQDVVVFVDGIDQKVEIFASTGLPEDAYKLSEVLTEHFAQGKLRNISVVSTGPGAKHTFFGCLNFSWYDPKRKRARYKQAGRGGVGTVFADKGIRALVARWDAAISLDTNQPAEKERLKTVAKQHAREIVALDPKQNEMATIGTTHIVTIMDDHDLLPTHNFRFGQHREAPNLGQAVFRRLFDPGYDGCWMGCTVACSHGVRDFVPLSGPYAGRKVFVDGPEYETIAGCGSNLGIFDPHTVIEMNFYCDAYGLDTISFGTLMAFVMECYEAGVLNCERTGGLDLSPLWAGIIIQVLLIEAGPSDRRVDIDVPVGYAHTYFDPRVNWMFDSEPEPELNNRIMYQPRGKVLGGTSSINGMVYMRGNAADFLVSLGRWGEAREMARRALEWAPSGVALVNAALRLAFVETETAADEEAARLLGRLFLELETIPDVQYAVPTYEVAASEVGSAAIPLPSETYHRIWESGPGLGAGRGRAEVTFAESGGTSAVVYVRVVGR